MSTEDCGTSTLSVNAAEEDHFSKLPRDCLLTVFSCCDRETLDESECLSKELREVVTDRSLRKIKIDGELFIYQHSLGHSFAMNRLDKDHCLSYNIKNEITPKGSRSKTETMYDKEISYFPPFPEVKTGQGIEDVVAHEQSTTIPIQLFNNLSVLLNKHYCEETVFQWIKVDQFFLDNMLKVDNRVPGAVKKFDFHEVQFDEVMEPNKFAHFLLDSKSTHVRIFNSRRDIPRIAEFLQSFGEEFMTAFAASHHSPSFLFAVFSGRGHHEKIPYYWTPSKAFFPILLQYQNFGCDNMVLEPELLATAIVKKCFDQERELCYQFSLTSELTREHFRPIIDCKQFFYFDDTPENEEESDGSVKHTIVRNGSRFMCNCSVSTKPNGDVLVQMLYGRMGPRSVDGGDEEEEMDEQYDEEYGEEEEDMDVQHNEEQDEEDEEKEMSEQQA